MILLIFDDKKIELFFMLSYIRCSFFLIFAVACGFVNLITPTSGVMMGGLAIPKIDFSSWIKFSLKIIATIFVVNIIILSIAMLTL